MKHQDYLEMIPFYVAQTLTDGEKKTFEAYLKSHPEIRTDVEEWRKIATATWLEGEHVGKKLPVFPKAVYTKLPAQTLTPALPDYAKKVVPVAPKPKSIVRSSYIPWVAVFFVAILFGGLALYMVNRTNNQQLNLAQLTPQTNPVVGAAIFEISPTIAVESNATQNINATSTAKPLPSRTFQATPRPQGTQLVTITAPALVTPTFDPSVPNCNISVTRGINVNIYAYADINAPVIGKLQTGESHTTYVKSPEGWIQFYKYTNDSYLLGWINPQDVDLVGYCALWVATPTLYWTPDLQIQQTDTRLPTSTFTPTPDLQIQQTNTPLPTSTFTPTPYLTPTISLT